VIDGGSANRTLAAMTDAVTAASQAADASGVVAPPTQTLMVLRAGSRWLALPAQAVREVVLKSITTRIPHAPPHVLGVALLRGRLLPVVSLEVLLPAGRETAPLPATLPRLVVIETDQAEAAIVAEEVHGIVDFVEDSLRDQATPARRPSWVLAELTWEGRLLCILQPERLLSATLGGEGER